MADPALTGPPVHTRSAGVPPADRPGVKPPLIKLFMIFPVAALVLVLDLITKWGASVALRPGRSVPLLGDLLRFTLVHNSGAAFGLFPGGGPAFVVFSIAAIGLILLLAWRLPTGSRGELVALGGLLGGAVGNLYDRLRSGVVIDFIDVGLGRLRWPVFNVADIAVTLGVMALLLGIARRPTRRSEL